MTEYVRGTTRLHEPAADEGISLAFMGLPAESMAAWAHFQAKMTNDPTPCYGRKEWTSGKAGDKAFAIAGCLVCHARPACAEFAETNNERGAVWGGVAR